MTTTLKARADRMIGVHGDSFAFTTYYITHQFDINLHPLEKKLGVHVSRSPAFCRLVLSWALLRYDVFNYFHDRGILPPNNFSINPEEMDALKAAGKRLYVYAYGADVRTRERTLALGRWNCCVDCDEPRKYCVCLEELGTFNVDRVASRATAMVSLGDMLEYTPGSKKLFYWPIDMSRFPESQSALTHKPATSPLIIAHAPNHGIFKGTKYLEETVERLKNEGVPIESRYLSGVPNDRVLSFLAEADLIVDQLICGGYGYTALEAMALGRPVLCYIRDESMVYEPSHCPIINASPDDLYEVLKWCVANRDELADRGRRGRRYVMKYHSVPAVATRFAQLYLETASLPAKSAARIAAAKARLEQELAAIQI